MSAGLAALSRADLEDLISEGKPVETCCRFCNKKYVFGTQEMTEFLKNR
jgi:molecular chaperone Hsp33